MNEQRFQCHRALARKDLLHYVEENLDKDVYRKIGENPEAWIDELEIISGILMREHPTAGIGLHLPPFEDPGFKKLGSRAYLYRGEESRLHGLWIKQKDRDLPLFEETTDERFKWAHYHIGTRAKLELLLEFERVNEKFLPENFEPVAKRATKEIHGRIEEANKRPILIFPVTLDGKTINVYAKGSFLMPGYYYTESKPGYRLTCLSSMQRVTSKKEMKVMQDLGNLGVNLPRILGYYQAPVEEFLFLEEVKGDHPNKHITTHRELIINQDAQMLAALCLAGHHKTGFAVSWDDKIFDGDNL